MDDRTKPTELAAAAASSSFRNGLENKTGLTRCFPTITHLRRHAPRHGPRFAFEYMDGGAGGEDAGIRRNWAALDAIELVPRYGITTELPPTDIELFGRRYSAPIGVAPMGGPSIVWPGADEYLAAAAQAARIPYVLGTVGGTTIEKPPRSPPTYSGSSSTAWRATSTPSASISCAAPRRRAHMC
jgi:L-lactate dehydrogenase (cytochrome)